MSETPEKGKLTKLYYNKSEGYFDGARVDFVKELPDSSSAHILEVGCSNGATGALALAMGKCGAYTGVESHEPAALKAAENISHVLLGDIEHMKLSWDDGQFDALILSEVLEHLVDPWSLLRRLHRYLKPGALVFASSPNISHHHIIRMLLKGEWNLTDYGIMDRTHLRWFTPKSFVEMFEENGYSVQKVEPISPFKLRDKVRIALFLGKGSHLFIKQIKIRAIRKPESVVN
jgi:2-polyprenyl-3-methyl-5-hydroxy-6-metoxy-1,4-benzoquinol methylase